MAWPRGKCGGYLDWAWAWPCACVTKACLRTLMPTPCACVAPTRLLERGHATRRRLQCGPTNSLPPPKMATPILDMRAVPPSGWTASNASGELREFLPSGSKVQHLGASWREPESAIQSLGIALLIYTPRSYSIGVGGGACETKTRPMSFRKYSRPSPLILAGSAKSGPGTGRRTRRPGDHPPVGERHRTRIRTNPRPAPREVRTCPADTDPP